MGKVKNKITVIVSSHLTNERNSEFIKHVNNTIGVDHEIKIIENFNEFSLAEVYNKAIDEYQSDDNIMVFCHPDIIFKTNYWGRLLLTHFNNSNYGVIGVAGTTNLGTTAKWWADRQFMIGTVSHTDGIKEWTNQFSEPFNGIKSVVMIDGLFIAIDPKKIINKFDTNYGKFHFYDASFCVPNYMNGVDIGVINNIRILHKSVGKTNQEWEENRIKFAEQYKNDLPVFIEPEYNEIDIKLTSEPKVSVIIPTKNNFFILKQNIDSWYEIVKYKNYEIIIADTGSDETTLKKYDEFLSDKIKLAKYDYYNFAKINNDVVKNHVSADTEVLLFCNDDIELLNDALTRCIELYNKHKNIGTIGVRLHYKNGSVQHCGIKVKKVKDGLNLTHVDQKKVINYSTDVKLNSAGNTGAFLMINKDLFTECEYFNETYIECLEDVELNFRCLLKNRKNITACDAVAYHYESMSRNKIQDQKERIDSDYFKILEPFYKTNKNKLNKFF